MNDKIIKDISENKGTVLIYINEEGEVIMITSGDMSSRQIKETNKIVTVIGDHSIVFSIVLGLEMMFNRISFFVGSLFRKQNK
tara:strand:+ start:126 stop:374 length:249 start_codon:yes stop_codon:yes gene_type:complete